MTTENCCFVDVVASHFLTSPKEAQSKGRGFEDRMGHALLNRSIPFVGRPQTQSLKHVSLSAKHELVTIYVGLYLI